MMMDLLRRCFAGTGRKASQNCTPTLRVNPLEERAVPAVATPHNLIVSAPGAGIVGTVKVYDANGNFKTSFTPYPGFFGGVRVAVGDVNNDGNADIITVPGPGGGPHVQVWNGAQIAANQTPTIINGSYSFYGFESTFTGGSFVAAGDINGDGFDDIILGPDFTGGPRVVAYSGANPAVQLVSFNAYDPAFTGGVRVASGDLGGDGVTAEIITAAGPGGGPHVQAFDYKANGTGDAAYFGYANRLTSFYAEAPSFSGGISVAVGYVSNNLDSSNNKYADIITAVDRTGTSYVRDFRLLDAVNDAQGKPNWTYFNASTFEAYTGFFGGVRVATVDRNGLSDILTGAGPTGGPHVRRWSSTTVGDLTTYTSTEIGTGFYAYDPAYLGGVYVG